MSFSMETVKDPTIQKGGVMVTSDFMESEVENCLDRASGLTFLVPGL